MDYRCTPPCLTCECWDLNSDPPACVSNTKPSSGPSVILLRTAPCFVTSLWVGLWTTYCLRCHQFIRRHRSAFLHFTFVWLFLSKKGIVLFFSWVLESFHSVFPGKLSTTLELFRSQGCVAATIIDVGDGSIRVFGSLKAQCPHPFQHSPNVPLSPNCDA